MTQPLEPQTAAAGIAAENLTYIRRVLQSFVVPAYRWLWFNSVFGTMRLIMVFLARGWLVLELTDSPFWVGFAPGLRGVTQIFVGAFSGVLLDRFDRKKMLVIAEFTTTVTAFIIGLLIIFEQVELWHIMAASAVEGIFMSMRWPAINTLVLETAGSRRVLNASAGIMLGFNVGNIVATVAAGLIIVQAGIGSAYMIAMVCGLAAVLSAILIPGDYQPDETEQEPVRRSLSRGIQYIWTHSALRWIMALTFLMSFLGWSHILMMPVMARDVLGVDAAGLGFLSAAGAVGAFLATFLLAGLKKDINKIRTAISMALITSILLIGFAISRWYLVSLGIKFFLQGALFGFEAPLMAIVLLITSARMQGRVQGVYSMLFGFTWMGGILMGSIAELYGAPLAIALGGIVIGVATILIWRPLQRVDFVQAAQPV